MKRTDACRRKATIRNRGVKMKQALAFGFLVLSVSACTQQSPPPSPTPAASTTPNFDGFYQNPVISAKSQGCPDLGNLPYLEIRNNLAVLQTQTLHFQGQVTPDGKLSMSSVSGNQMFDGQIDPHFVLNSTISGPNCSYHVTWTRAS